MRKKLLFVVALSFMLVGMHAQEAVSSSGGSFSTATNSASWTVGQPVAGTLEGSTHTLMQGFQQNYMTITSVEDEALTDMSIKAFPNPSHNYVNIRFEEVQLDAPRVISLVDMTGRELLREETREPMVRIKMSTYEPAVYFIKITCEDKELRTFKIVKN